MKAGNYETHFLSWRWDVESRCIKRGGGSQTVRVTFPAAWQPPEIPSSLLQKTASLIFLIPDGQRWGGLM